MNTPDIPEKLLKPYDPQKAEARVYDAWEKSGFFNPDTCIQKGVTEEDAPVFSIILPPPNVTGTLHMGHAAMLAVEDILVRFERMRGKRTLWLPGTDHAAIATQSKVEKELVKKEKKNRHDLGREEFLKRVEKFAQESHDTIVNQVKRMGSSVDWSREAFTLDDTRRKAVYTAFKSMYEAGLIEQGLQTINWDPKGQTTVSDDEVVHEEQKGTLYTFKYSKDFPISIATTRPETKLGDTAVAVHPDDDRYAEYVGKEYTMNFAGATITVKVIADPEVDKEFGTGAVGVTPAHSMVDFEMARRHDLPVVQVIDEYARMMVGSETIKGAKTSEAREEVVKWLEGEGLLESTEEITQNISKAERSGGVIEPLPKKQWFIRVNKEFAMPHSEIEGIKEGDRVSLKSLMRHVVESGQIAIMPDRFEKIYYHWIDNLRDWCISRQIWYGHRIPVWYRGDEVHVGLEAPEGNDWEQDPDTLDTWFSSGLWTFSTLGWPEKTDDFKTYHPTTVLETGYDILFFWVARMILMSTYHVGQIPFRYVYLHGLVRDKDGKKMSKSLGNIIDPLDMIEKYGADATRMSLIVGAAVGSDLSLGEDKVRAYKKFSNKLWNMARFILSSTEPLDVDNGNMSLSINDMSRMRAFEEFKAEITKEIESFNLHLAAEKLYHYLWHEVADVVIEEAKPRLTGSDEKERASASYMLRSIFLDSLAMLHPFMPFVTEEIWSLFHEGEGLLMVTPWPEGHPKEK